MNVKNGLLNRLRGWFPQDPKIQAAKTIISNVHFGRFVLGATPVPILCGLLSGSLTALFFVAFKMYPAAVGSFIPASLGAGFTIRKQIKVNSLQLFKEKLEQEGTIEVTKRMVNVSKFPEGRRTIEQILQDNSSSFETATIGNRSYVFHQATLTGVLGKMPINKKDTDSFTEAQRHVLNLAISINLVQDNGEVITTAQKTEADL
jgi:hypothetical protein